MRAASTSRFQLTGDQRHSRSLQSSIRRTASAAAEGSPQSRRSRSQAKPFRLSSHSTLVPSRRHGGSSLPGATGPTWPWAISSPTTNRRPTTASPGHGSGATAKKLRGLPRPRVSA